MMKMKAPRTPALPPATSIFQSAIRNPQSLPKRHFAPVTRKIHARNFAPFPSIPFCWRNFFQKYSGVVHTLNWVGW
jgi:hypothetical protein